MIPLALGAAFARIAQKGVLPPRPANDQAPPPRVAVQSPVPGPQAPVNPNGALPPRPVAPPPRVDDPRVPPPILVPNGPGAGEVPNGPLTAQEVSRIVLRRQPNVQAARGQAQSARGNADITASDLNPQVTLNGGFTNTRVAGGLGGPTGGGAPGTTTFPASTSVGLSQLLFDFGQTRNLARRDRSLAQAAEADLSRAALLAVNDADNAFYNVANDRRLVLAAEADVINRQRQLDLARGRFASGIGAPLDVVTAETSKAQAVQALIRARDTENQDRVTLLQLMGLNPLTPIEVAQVDEPADPAQDPRELVLTGLRRRPEIRAAGLTVSAYRSGLSAAKATSLPSIVGTLGGGLGGDSLGGTYGSSTALGVGLVFPLFDGGRRRGAVNVATGQLTTAQANLRSAILQVQADVVGAYFAERAAEQRVAAAGSEVNNASEAVRIAEGRYANGLGQFQDITTAQSQLNLALQDAATARNALNLARVRRRYATAGFDLG